MLLDEVSNANLKVLSSDVVKKAVNELGWNWYREHVDNTITTVRVPIKLWKFSTSINHVIKVSDVQFLFTLLFGPEQ